MTIGRIPSVEGGIQPTIVDAKGDLIAATAADTVNRLAVGSNDQVLVADSSASTGLAWKSVATPFAAGKNKIINGDFSIWQRGTTFSNPVAATYTADRYNITYDGSGATRTISRQAFTVGSAPVAGYESEFFLRYERSVAGTGATFDIIRNNIEDVRTFAGQTITVSFWAKADSGTPTITIAVQQVFGTGGSVAIRTDLGTATLSTSWARYTATGTVPSISGKTLGANNYFSVQLRTPVNTIQTFDFWGVQAEAGSVATAFQTATGNPASELAACQRYYYLHASGTNFAIGQASAYSATSAQAYVKFPVTMRATPTTACVTGTNFYSFIRNGGQDDFNSLTLDVANTNGTMVFNNTEIASTAGHAGYFQTINASSFVAFTAEL